jgi:hypothetical protein
VPVRIQEAGDLNSKTGYKYVSGLSPNSASSTVIMYSARRDSRGRHWVLFTSGRVRPVQAASLKQMLGGGWTAELAAEKAAPGTATAKPAVKRSKRRPRARRRK